MEILIWSDVMCPFCYIGKRKLEKAIAEIQSDEHINIVWKSFQLNPNLKTDPTKSLNEYLAQQKGWTDEYTLEASNHVTSVAKEVGLNYQLHKAVLANSMDAHRLSHLALKYGVQNELEELLFKAYFEEGLNTADEKVLRTLGSKVSLPDQQLDLLFTTDLFKKEVEEDMLQAQQIGVQGVPFFVFNQKYAIS